MLSTLYFQVYPTELEAIPQFNEFKEWLQSFELYRGKKTGDDDEDDSRIVGLFKVIHKIRFRIINSLGRFLGCYKSL